MSLLLSLLITLISNSAYGQTRVVQFTPQCPSSIEADQERGQTLQIPTLEFTITTSRPRSEISLTTPNLNPLRAWISNVTEPTTQCILHSLRYTAKAQIQEACRQMIRSTRLQRLECEDRLLNEFFEFDLEFGVALSYPIGTAPIINTQNTAQAGYLPFETFAASQNTEYTASVPTLREETLRNCALIPDFPSIDTTQIQQTYLRRQFVISQRFLTEELPSLLAESNPTCRANILKSLTRAFGSPPVVQSEREIRSANQVIALVNSQLQLLNDSADHGLCLVNTSLSILEQMTQSNRSLSDIVNCAPLDIGESVVPPLSGTPVNGNYRLTRTGENAFKAEIDLNFYPSENANTMRKHAQTCLSELSQMLQRTGPGVGSLEIVLTPLDNLEVPRSDIKIMEHPFRSNRLQWDSEINCETVAHETLHILGLVDEYHENSIGYVHSPDSSLPTRVESGPVDIREYSCRAIGPLDSIMSHQSNAYARFQNNPESPLLFPAQFRAIVQPNCHSANPEYLTCSQYAYTYTPEGIGSCPKDRPSYCGELGRSLPTRDPRWLREVQQ